MNLGNLMIVQGGGPTAVLNASLASIIGEAARMSPSSKIFGARAGAAGLSRGHVVDLNGLSATDLKLLSRSPGAALGSSRFKPSTEDLKQQVELLRKLEISAVLYMGGNGSMRGGALASAAYREAGLEVQVLGVPKTVDNDIAGTDRCPGYASAARFVAQSTRELVLDIRSLPQPITILETMGRSVGWLAAAATLARTDEEDGPQLMYVPEVRFVELAFLDALEAVMRKHGWAVVVVAEGIRNGDGSLVYEESDPAQQDALKRNIVGGVGQHLAGIVAAKLRTRCRSEKPGLLARASTAHVSPQDLADAVAVGRAAVRALAAGEDSKMVALLPFEEGHAPECCLVALSGIGGVERELPAAWLTTGPDPIANEFLDYARPLVGDLNEHFRGFAAHSTYT